MLRAFYFFELARRYGDIAMPTRMLTIEEANTIGKTSFDEVIGFIVAECDACAADGNLPNTYVGEPGNETGRITRGFALALKSKALLYAASELHNPSMDVERWKRSAKAALDLIETGLYSLDPADKSNNITSPEVVLLRMNSDDNTFELRNFPIRFTEGRRTTAATGTYVGGSDYASIAEGGSPTGYFLRKYIQESTDLNPNTPVSNKHHWIVYRYAETLLTYAESMVEAFGDPDYTDETYPYSARWAINQVRANVGMPDITVTGKTDFIAALRNEWRVEFAFEDHRFWDVRRWKIGDATQRRIHGVEITRTGSEYTFRRKVCEQRTWADRMYLYPIPQSELYKNPNLAPQNTGW